MPASLSRSKEYYAFYNKNALYEETHHMYGTTITKRIKLKIYSCHCPMHILLITCSVVILSEDIIYDMCTLHSFPILTLYIDYITAAATGAICPFDVDLEPVPTSSTTGSALYMASHASGIQCFANNDGLRNFRASMPSSACAKSWFI